MAALLCAILPQHAAAARHHAGIRRGPAAGRCGADRGNAIARHAVEHGAQGDARIPLEFGLGDPRLLKVQLIELRVRGPRHHAGRRHGAAQPERHAEGGDGAEAVRPQARRLPGDGRPQSWPTMTAVAGIERVEQPDDVADQVKQVYWSIGSGRSLLP